MRGSRRLIVAPFARPFVVWSRPRLVSVRHGGASTVLDYRQSAGLDLLPSLLLSPDGNINVSVVRSIIEMRSAIAPDVARLAAQRAGKSIQDSLEPVLEGMLGLSSDLNQLQQLALKFWTILVGACGNVAYVLAYNSLQESYDLCRPVLAEVLSAELQDLKGYRGIARAVAQGNESRAESLARKLIRQGEEGILKALRPLHILSRRQNKGVS